MSLKFPKYRKEVSLIPGAALQFIDLAFDANRMPKVTSQFWEYDVPGNGIAEYRLRPLVEDKESGDVIDRQTMMIATDPRTDTNGPGSGKRIQPEYSINSEKALEPFIGRWIPLPVFRAEDFDADGHSRFADGPTDWARLRIVQSEKPDQEGHTHVVTIAFDLSYEDTDEALFGEGEAQPQLTKQDDVARSGVYVLASEFAQSSWWLNLEWVDRWIKTTYVNFLRERNPGRAVDETKWANKCEYLARYITLIDILAALDIIPRLRLTDPDRHDSVDVDLVLDIGNSRTCGMLIERGARDTSDMGDSTVLEIRNLSHPEVRYQEPFSSHVAFARANFTDRPEEQETFQPISGRTIEGFDWPTVVRIGPEAVTLASLSRREEGQTSMSSPKRYLWDRDARDIQWRFCPERDSDLARELPVTMGTYCLYVNNEGTPVRAFKDPRQVAGPVFRMQEPDPVLQPIFSRSSLMMFLMSELILHALVQMNSPGYRQERVSPDIPRRLRSIILTMPTAMPIAERKILYTWANWAVETLWESMGWEAALENDTANYKSPPRVRCEWDEATATQLVYLYNEVAERFAGDVEAYFGMRGRDHGPGKENSVRIASIDIGGGTTDLIIATYTSQTAGAAGVIDPKQDFREGFNTAGDHILKNLIENHVLSGLQTALEEAGASQAREVLIRCLGRDFVGLSEHERNLRAQFVNQIAVPFGLEILHASENANPWQASQVFSIDYATAFDRYPEPRAEVLEYISRAARDAGAPGFDMRDFKVEVDLSEVGATIVSAIEPVLDDLCEVIQRWDCDALVLAGRPSRLPVIQATILGKAPVPPDRFIALSEYKVGYWYPFWSPGGKVSDPKTTACVGAVLCALAEGNLPNFRFETTSLKPKSTARYFGEMELTGQIRQQNVFFEAIDMESREELEQETEVVFNAPIYLGFRQLSVERWTAKPFYQLKFSSQQAANNARGKLPYKVKLLFKRSEDDDDDVIYSGIGGVRDEGSFTIEEIVCAGTKDPVRSGELELKLRTMRDEEGHWMDSGILEVR
jgi:hypothetical protein